MELSNPVFSSHGEYWYALHVALVNDARCMELRKEVLHRLVVMIEGVTAKHGYRLSRAAVLPDHLHLTIGGPIERSPEEIALAYLNNCAYACGMRPVFRFGYYVGTIGEYDRGAVL